MSKYGFSGTIPENWNRWWLLMWGGTSVALIVLAFFLEVWAWIPAALVLFLLPEIISLVKQNDSLPPLTHTIRHFVPNWVAFPAIYFLLGTAGAHWLDYDRPWGVGLLMGLLGWLTDHFAVTYAGKDPHPYTNREHRPGADAPRLPA